MPGLKLLNKNMLLTAFSAYAAFDVALYATYLNKYTAETKALTQSLQLNDYMWPGVAAAGVGGLLAYQYINKKAGWKDYLLVALGAYAAFDVALYATYLNRAPEKTKAVVGKLEAQDYLWPAVAAVGTAAIVGYYATPNKGIVGYLMKAGKKMTKK